MAPPLLQHTRLARAGPRQPPPARARHQRPAGLHEWCAGNALKRRGAPSHGAARRPHLACRGAKVLDYSPSSSQPDAPKSRRSLVDNMSGSESGTVAPATTETRLDTLKQRLDTVLRVLERFTQHTTPASPPASGAGPSRVEAATGQPGLATCAGGEEVRQAPPPVDVLGGRHVTYIKAAF